MVLSWRKSQKRPRLFHGRRPMLFIVRRISLAQIRRDGAPGIGCPVTGAPAGTGLAVVVTEPTLSG